MLSGLYFKAAQSCAVTFCEWMQIILSKQYGLCLQLSSAAQATRRLEERWCSPGESTCLASGRIPSSDP